MGFLKDRLVVSIPHKEQVKIMLHVQELLVGIDPPLIEWEILIWNQVILQLQI